MCDGDSQLYLTFYLFTTDTIESETFDNLFDLGIKWVDFDPMPDD